MTILQWQRNEVNIGGSFNSNFNNGAIQQEDSFTLILDSITTRELVANITSRLVTNISNLESGDQIRCAAISITPATIALDYRLRGTLYKFNHQSFYNDINMPACSHTNWPLLFSAL